MDDFLKSDVNDIPLNLCKKCGKCEIGHPVSIWDKMPDGCGFYGWLFQAQETVKQKIRVQKEELILLQIAIKSLQGEPLESALKRISEIDAEINKYSDYDSKDW